MTTKTDILPEQDAYFLLHDGHKYAIHGGSPIYSGLLVFSTLQAAKGFCRSVGKLVPGFRMKPKELSAAALATEARKHGGKVCVRRKASDDRHDLIVAKVF